MFGYKIKEYCPFTCGYCNHFDQTTTITTITQVTTKTTPKPREEKKVNETAKILEPIDQKKLSMPNGNLILSQNNKSVEWLSNIPIPIKIEELIKAEAKRKAWSATPSSLSSIQEECSDELPFCEMLIRFCDMPYASIGSNLIVERCRKTCNKC